MNPELEQLAQRVVGALVNGLYQGLLLVAVLWLGLKLFRGVNAATRHAVGLLVLVLVAALPVLHFLMPLRMVPPTIAQTSPLVLPAPLNSGAGESGTDAAPWADDSMIPSAPVGDDMTGRLAAAGETSSFSELGLPVADPGPQALPELADAEAVIPTPDLSPPSHAITIVGSVLSEPLPSPFTLPSPHRWHAKVPGPASVIFMLLLGTVAGVRLLRLGWQWWVLLRLKRSATLPSSELTATFASLRAELRVARSTRLLVAERISTPMAVGYFRSAVLLPAALVHETNKAGLAGILRHELAHIRRCDDWCNLLQQVIAAIHFYHPAVAWLSRRLTLDREVACDDIALAPRASRRDYALLLAEFAGRNRGREWIAAPAAWSNRSQLKERINMILDPHRNTSRRLARTRASVLTVATLATAGLALIAGPRFVLAASADEASAPPAAETTEAAVVSPAGDNLIVHAGDVPLRGVTIGAPAGVEWSVDHQHFHTVDVERGPEVVISTRPAIRVNPRATVAVPGSSAYIVAQAPAPEPEQPVEVRPPKAPKPGRAPKALPAPAAAPAPGNPGESMEQRMERLERMLEQLVGDKKFHFELKPGKELELEGYEWRGQLPPPGEPFNWKVPSPDQHWPNDEAQRKAMEGSVKAAEKQMERAMKEAHREVTRANEAVERTHRDAELRAQLEMKKELGRTFKETDIHRRALEDQRRSLEREMENLERQRERVELQIERLDHQMERLEERTEESDERDELVGEEDAQPRVKEKAEKN